MLITIERIPFIAKLDAVSPGIATREIIEQACCYVFTNGRIKTFNEEVACSVKSGLPKSFTGAVQAAPLVEILRRMTEDTLTIEATESEIILVGKGGKRRSGVRMEQSILLPVDKVEPPGEWVELPIDFADAVYLVGECAGTNKSEVYVNIHIHPNYMEACDNIHQMIRYKIKTGIKKDTCIRQASTKKFPGLELSHISDTDNWLHFKNPHGLVLSCRKYPEEFPEMIDILKVKGSPIELPKALAEALDKARVFSDENADDKLVTLTLKPGTIVIKGVGVHGWYREERKMKYKGKPLSFQISPTLMTAIINKYRECQITDFFKLKVKGGKFTYVASLNQSETKEETNDVLPREDD